ncbi:MAG: hypothetical protein LBK07_04545 [Tannerella sp.]|jgi:hypothetical protein|nr:hypothetical protein [Tannerella sp.]
MAKKKKSKQNNYARRKIEETQRRNEYFKRLKAICDMIHPDLHPMLGPLQRMILYESRGLPFKVLADGKVSEELMDAINEYARMVQKKEAVPIDAAEEHKISIMEYHRYLSPLEWLIRPDGPYDPDIRPEPDRFKGFPWYESFFEHREKRLGIYYRQITQLFTMVMSFVSDLRYYIYYMHFEEVLGGRKNTFDLKYHLNIHIQPHRVERRHIRLHNGEKRNALRMTVSCPPDAARTVEVPENLRFFPLSISPSFIGAKGFRANKRRPIYVSEHALNRLDERTGCASSGYMQMFMYQSLSAATSLELKDGRLLLEFRAFNHKIGYLVLSIQPNSILVHTFLLLTADGTPEGKNLRRQLGLQKQDHQYLGIDKLSTFIHSDILQHEDVCQWFRDAGCESLLKVCEVLKTDELWTQDSEQIRLAGRIREYLKANEPTDAWDIPEEEENSGEEENGAEEEDAAGQLPPLPIAGEEQFAGVNPLYGLQGNE